MIQWEASDHHLDPALLVALIGHESHFDAHAVSAPRGPRDCGLGQIRTTGAGRGFTCRQLMEPSLNIHLTASYLASWVGKCRGNLVRALSGYNRGHGCYPNDYGRRVNSEYHNLKHPNTS